MADNNTLISYLVPRLTIQVENAATDALGYIVNKSSDSMQALNELLSEGGFGVEKIVRVETQVTHEDGSRPDMAGYDKNNVMRLLVEAKFWAALSEGQASGYARQFNQTGPSVLLFVSPEVRIPTLWAEIKRQLEEQCALEPVESTSGVPRARVIDEELHVMLVSWIGLLDRMEALAGDDGIKSDIRQLRDLAEAQDTNAFLPIRSEELSPSLAHRLVSYTQLVDDVVTAGLEGWVDTQGLRATPQWYGYGRYFCFVGVEPAFWFGINYERWAASGDTPLWLSVPDTIQIEADEVGRELNVQVQDGWIPIYPKLGVEYPQVLADVASKLEAIAKIVGARLPAE